MPPPDLKNLVDPATGERVNVYSVLGSIRSARKAEASRKNGQKGGIAKGTKLKRKPKVVTARKKRVRKVSDFSPNVPVAV